MPLTNTYDAHLREKNVKSIREEKNIKYKIHKLHEPLYKKE